MPGICASPATTPARPATSFRPGESSRDTIGYLRRLDMIASGPRSPQPGAPYTYVTTRKFLEHFGLDTLRDLPDLEDAGLLSRAETADVEMAISGDEPDGSAEPSVEADDPF